MKKFVAIVMLFVMIAGEALACGCMTDEVRIALFDLMGVADLEMDGHDHDALVSAYLGIDCKCETTKYALVNVMCSNYERVCEALKAEKVTVIKTYLSHCGCGCGDEDEEMKTETTVVPTATPRPGRTPKPSKPTATKCVHTGGSHENGGKCTLCGVVYQEHVWGAWSSPSADKPHKRTCSCGFVFSGKHSWSEGEKKSGKVYKTCKICGYAYWGGIYTTTHEGCGCQCGGCRRNGCVNCSCGCGAHG